MSILNPPCFLRRIKNEFGDLSNPTKLPLNYSLSFQDINENFTIFFITNNNNKKKTILKFIVTREYPFKSPQFFINNIKYELYYKNLPFHINKFLIEKLNVQCLCCSTILCSHNWNPGIKILDIIKEFEFRENLIKLWFIKNVLMKLSLKYNNFNEDLINLIIDKMY